MTLIVADSGSTKTDWVCMNASGEVTRLKTLGLNPYFASAGQIRSVFQNEVLRPLNVQSPFKVFFYGAGCGSRDNCSRVSDVFSDCGASSGFAGTDLLGAARSLIQEGEGLAGILGTGANAGIYRGGRIIQSAPSTGFILGDEGSATWFGKRIITSWLRKQWPSELHDAFEDEFRPERDEVIRKIYKEAFPNRYLAGFAVFLEKRLKDEWVIRTAREGLDLFLQNYILILKPAEGSRLVMAGSVAVAFRNLLEELCVRTDLILSACSASVADGLLKFHLDHPELHS